MKTVEIGKLGEEIAKKYLEKAKEYSNYFYENKLANMLNAVEYKLKMLEDAAP